jgi:hypothetical protein
VSPELEFDPDVPEVGGFGVVPEDGRDSGLEGFEPPFVDRRPFLVVLVLFVVEELSSVPMVNYNIF